MQKNLQSVSPVSSPVITALKNVVDTARNKSAPIELDAVQLKEVSGGTTTGSTAGPNGTW
jgi:hypothetical protein